MAKRKDLDPRFREMYQEQEDISHHERNRKRDFLQESRGSTHFVVSRLVNYIKSQLENPESDIEHLKQKMLNTNDKKLFDLWQLARGDVKTRTFLEVIAAIKLRNNPNSISQIFIDQERFNENSVTFLEEAIDDPERDVQSLRRYLESMDSSQLLSLWKYAEENPAARQAIEAIANERAAGGKQRLQRLIQEYQGQ